MRRQQFLGALGSAAAMPHVARAQERMRRVGVLFGTAEDTEGLSAYRGVFLRGSEHLGWTDGRNVRIDYRWADGDADANPQTRRRNWSH